MKPWEANTDIVDAPMNIVESLAPCEGSSGFTNRGFAYIKRVVVDGTEEKIVIDAIRITTARVDKIRRDFSRERAPRAPSISKFVHHDSEEGKALGLSKPQVVEIPNFNDENYQKQVADFAEKFNWSLAAEAIDLPMVYSPGDGQPTKAAQTTDEKIMALKQAGFKHVQVEAIAADVIRISNFTEEERRSFFGLTSE